MSLTSKRLLSIGSAGSIFSVLLAVGVVMAAVSVGAVENVPQVIKSQGLGLSDGIVKRLEQTVLKLEMDKSNDRAYCSVFPVSPDGYLLTALHCVRSCLVEQGLVDEASNIFIGLQDLLVVHDPQRVNTLCPKFEIPALGIKGDVKIVATGPALTLYNSAFLSDVSGLHRELFEKGWERKANDYALLKIEPKASTQPSQRLRCLRLNPMRLRGGLEVYSVGFPLPSQKNAEPVLSASRGVLFARPEHSETYKSQSTPEGQSLVRAQYGAPGLIFSSAANTFGQSGGPIVASDGSVIGITSGFATPTGGNPLGIHELVGGNIESVLRNLPAEIAQEILRSNAACGSN